MSINRTASLFTNEAAVIKAGAQIGYMRTASSISASGTALIPSDNTVPQISEGNALTALTTTYTPKRADSLLEVEVTIPYIAVSASAVTPLIAVFRDGAADAIHATYAATSAGAGGLTQVSMRFVIPANSIVSTTFTVRYGGNTASTLYVLQSSAGDRFGDSDTMTLTVKEISTVDVALYGQTVSTTGLQIGNTTTKTSSPDSSASVIPTDNTIPQISEGKEYAALTTTYTPKLASSKLRLTINIPVICMSNIGTPVLAVFRDGATNAIATFVAPTVPTGNYVTGCSYSVEVPANTNTPTTFVVRYGPNNANTLYIMQLNSGGVFETTDIASFSVDEIAQEQVAFQTGVASVNGVQIGFSSVESAALDSTALLIPLDASIPQVTEGKEYTPLTITHTPQFANSILVVEFFIAQYALSTSANAQFAMFLNGGADAICSVNNTPGAASYSMQAILRRRMVAGSVAAKTFTLRYGGNGGSMYINQRPDGLNLGGLAYSHARVTEYKG